MEDHFGSGIEENKQNLFIPWILVLVSAIPAYIESENAFKWLRLPFDCPMEIKVNHIITQIPHPFYSQSNILFPFAKGLEISIWNPDYLPFANPNLQKLFFSKAFENQDNIDVLIDLYTSALLDNQSLLVISSDITKLLAGFEAIRTLAHPFIAY